jgi:hypothetical protein
MHLMLLDCLKRVCSRVERHDGDDFIVGFVMMYYLVVCYWLGGFHGTAWVSDQEPRGEVDGPIALG